MELKKKMAHSESLRQQVVNQLKTIAKRFNRKFAEVVFLLLTHKGAGSFGALAGFAIAVLFTWKFLKSPARPRRKQKKEPSSVSSDCAAFPANGVTSPSDSFQQNVTVVKPEDDLHPPAKLALAQVVKKKLCGSRKMTCQLLGVILEEKSPEELQDRATVRSSVVDVILELCKFCDIYLMERILDDESGEKVISALDNGGLFKAGGLMKDKVLFCSTENGRSSFIRQLLPDWHVDTNTDVLSHLSKFVPNLLYISSTGSSFASGSNIISSTNLEVYFAEGGDW